MIRAATVIDLPALAHLWHEKMVLQADHRTLPAPNARDLWMAAAHTWLSDARCGFFAAERDQEVIGYIVGWLQPMPGLVPEQIGLITEIAIDAHGYHGGVGRALVAALRNWFSGKGASKIAIWTPHYDAVSQAFWRSLGAAEWVDVLWIK
ncbi:MAG: GNAT family N-acetyltransferase [Chloroflexota bacterium]